MTEKNDRFSTKPIEHFEKELESFTVEMVADRATAQRKFDIHRDCLSHKQTVGTRLTQLEEYPVKQRLIVQRHSSFFIHPDKFGCFDCKILWKIEENQKK